MELPAASPMLQSRREVRPGFEAAGPADPALPMRLAVVLKPHQPLPEAEWAGAPWNRLRPSYEEHVARHGARGRDIRDVVAFAEATQLEVVRTSAAAWTVILRRVSDRALAVPIDAQRRIVRGI